MLTSSTLTRFNSKTMTRIHYAIGDVHGRDDLLEQMHARVRAHHEAHHAERPATIVHVGDYVDRGPDSIKVIDRLMRGLAGFEVICLKGNHDAMLLTCAQTDSRQAWLTWLGNGGAATLMSLGVSLRFGGFEPKDVAGALGNERLAWLRKLAAYHLADGFLFVHAGILPGRPIEEQREEDLLWIRRRFLESDADHGVLVIHGHTPRDEPEVRHNRIGIDTGAAITGRLTAVVLAGMQAPEFLTVQGEPAY